MSRDEIAEVGPTRFDPDRLALRYNQTFEQYEAQFRGLSVPWLGNLKDVLDDLHHGLAEL